MKAILKINESNSNVTQSINYRVFYQSRHAKLFKNINNVYIYDVRPGPDTYAKLTNFYFLKKLRCSFVGRLKHEKRVDKDRFTTVKDLES